MNPLKRSTPALTADGWAQGANPHEPGKDIVLHSGRVYRVDARGAWIRDRRLEQELANMAKSK